ncbi:filamentous hemagglutinin N-terminal domain-containing protein, partial [Adonisia turfae]|uniref:two-partner secretion domain-containing protein n=1 Tax=Adonisia turfae TaxID=2950184 RepID=UPI0032B5B428
MLTLPAVAQIVPDSTLGNEGSLLIEDVEVRGDLADLVEGGATRGGNLFHSFFEFNVDEGQRVYFANPVGIESILGRVTGENPSNIFGLLGVDGGADLFLLNPNGIVFGETASFDIEGAFYGTTGDAVDLGEDGIFSAVEPGSSRLLRVNPSVLLENYLTADSGDIESRGQLAVLGDLVLAGNGLDLQGQVAAGGDLTLLGLDEVRIRDTSETPFVGFAGGDLLVQGNQQVDIVALSHPDSGLFSYGDMVLRSESPVGGDAHYWSGGGFRVETLDGDAGDLESPVDPIIRSLGNVVIGDYIGNSLHIIAGGGVFIPGTIRIAGADDAQTSIQEVVTLSNGETLSIDGNTFATLDIRAGVSAEKIGLPIGLTGTGIFPNGGVIDDTPIDADIRVGNIILDEPEGLVFLTNQYFPNEALTPSNILIFGQGNPRDDATFPVLGIDARGFGGVGGQVVVDARENFLLDDGARIDTSSVLLNAGDIDLIAQKEIFLDIGAGIGAISDVLEGGDISLSASNVDLSGANTVISSGNDGNISLEVDRLNIGPLSSVISRANGAEDGGDVNVLAETSIEIFGGNLGTFDSPNSSGDSGNVTIQTGTLTFRGAFLEVIPGEPMGFGNISSDIGGTGSAGNILIGADQVHILDGAQIRADLLGTNNSPNSQGGDITLVVSGLLEVAGFLSDNDISKISTNVRPGTRGNGGNLTIEAGRVLVRDGAQIQAGAFGQGQGGSIFISSDEAVDVLDYSEDDRVSGIFAGPEGDSATGNGGDISVFSDIISILGSEAFISNEVDGGASGNAGNVDINSRILTIKDGGRIVNGTEGDGRGGTLVVNSSDLVEVVGTGGESTPSSLSTATFGYADGGDLIINTEDLYVLGGAQVVSSSAGLQTGRGGNLNVNASGTVEVSGVSADGNFISALSAGSGFLEDVIFRGSVADGGNLSISAENLIISDSASVSTEAFGRGLNPDFPGQAGDAGNLIVNVSERLDVRNGSGLEASTYGPGDAGNLTISARTLVVQNDSEISATTNGERQAEFSLGDSGNLNITVTGLTELIGEGGIGASSIFGGNAADIELKTGTLIIRDGASISAISAFGGGNAGNIKINASDSLVVTGGRFVRGSELNEIAGEDFFRASEESFVSSSINVLSDALPGSLIIETAQLQVLDGASINADTAGPNKGGDISITAPSVDVVGTAVDGTPSEIVSQTIRSGDAGNIFIESSVMTIRDGGQVLTSALDTPNTEPAEGDAGQITLRVPISLRLQNGTIGTNAESSNGGQLQIDAGIIVLLDDSDIQTFVNSGENSGGDITIRANALVALDDSDIIAFSADGKGGNIDLSQTAVFSQNLEPTIENLSREELLALDGNGQVDINATGGIESGEIFINDASFIENSLNELSGEFVDTAKLTAGSCIVNADNDNTGSFVVTGGEGLPQQPGTAPLAVYLTDDIQSPTSSTATSDIQEAHGVYQLADGRLVLSH